VIRRDHAGQHIAEGCDRAGEEREQNEGHAHQRRIDIRPPGEAGADAQQFRIVLVECVTHWKIVLAESPGLGPVR